MKLTGTGVLALAALGVGLVILARLPRNALNPASQDNLAHQLVNDTGAALTGDQDFSIGVALWEWQNWWLRHTTGGLFGEPDLTTPTTPEQRAGSDPLQVLLDGPGWMSVSP